MRAAREVFSELGYDAATFQAIAVRADLTRPAINHYFPGKRVLYREVVTQTNATLISACLDRARDETSLRGRMSALIGAAIQLDSKDRSLAAFLVASVLEEQRHPEWAGEHNSLPGFRSYISWAVGDSMERGELSPDTDVFSVVEMLVVVLLGLGFYAGFVGAPSELEAITEKLDLLLANKLGPVGG